LKDSFSSQFASHMEDFIRFKEALGYSRSSYAKFLFHFDRFCLSTFPKETALTKELLMQWARLHPNEHANGLKRRMVALREFGKYLNAVEIEAYVIPSEMIGSFKPFSPYLFSDKELSAFFAAADGMTPHKLSPYRQYIVPVIFRLLYCCGLRPNEVRLIQCSDMDLETGKIYIRDTKVHKDRTVVMSPDLLSLCKKCDTRIRTVQKNREYFFPHPNGTSYSANWVQNQFWKCWEMAGIRHFRGATTPRVYDFRHNYATRILMKWMEEGRDLYTWFPYLSAYMGHAAFSNTAYYIHLLPERLMKTSAIEWSRFSDLIPEVNP
jgi:integrase/recombinase XerD